MDEFKIRDLLRVHTIEVSSGVFVDLRKGDTVSTPRSVKLHNQSCRWVHQNFLHRVSIQQEDLVRRGVQPSLHGREKSETETYPNRRNCHFSGTFLYFMCKPRRGTAAAPRHLPPPRSELQQLIARWSPGGKFPPSSNKTWHNFFNPVLFPGQRRLLGSSPSTYNCLTKTPLSTKLTHPPQPHARFPLMKLVRIHLSDINIRKFRMTHKEKPEDTCILRL